MKTNKMKTNNSINFGKYALITGASGLLGKKHAEALLEIGTSVVLTDIDLDLLKKTKEELELIDYKGKIICYLMNVTSEDSILKVSNELAKENIRVDILINNAAINPKASSLKDNIRTTRIIVDKYCLYESKNSGKTILSIAIEKKVRKNHKIICGSREFKIISSPRHFVFPANEESRLWIYFLVIHPVKIPIKMTKIGLPHTII